MSYANKLYKKKAAVPAPAPAPAPKPEPAPEPPAPEPAPEKPAEVSDGPDLAIDRAGDA